MELASNAGWLGGGGAVLGRSMAFVGWKSQSGSAPVVFGGNVHAGPPLGDMHRYIGILADEPVPLFQA